MGGSFDLLGTDGWLRGLARLTCPQLQSRIRRCIVTIMHRIQSAFVVTAALAGTLSAPYARADRGPHPVHAPDRRTDTWVHTRSLDPFKKSYLKIDFGVLIGKDGGCYRHHSKHCRLDCGLHSSYVHMRHRRGQRHRHLHGRHDGYWKKIWVQPVYEIRYGDRGQRYRMLLKEGHYRGIWIPRHGCCRRHCARHRGY